MNERFIQYEQRTFDAALGDAEQRLAGLIRRHCRCWPLLCLNLRFSVVEQPRDEEPARDVAGAIAVTEVDDVATFSHRGRVAAAIRGVAEVANPVQPQPEIPLSPGALSRPAPFLRLARKL